MTKDQAFNIGLALNRIAMLVDDDTFRKIKPSLSEIEAIVSDISKENDEDDK